MNKYEFSTIGQFHTNHNEDFYVSESLEDHKLFIAVMDGCTMGKESNFASTLVGKILRKEAKARYYQSFAERRIHSISDLLFIITKRLFNYLVFLKNELSLETDELLSTLMLGIVDTSEKEAELLIIGDGLVCCNGTFVEYEQDNKPDYLGYHLGEEFEEWYAKQNQRLYFSKVHDLSIATDGILSFMKYDDKDYKTITEQKLIYYLLNDETESKHENMLKKKVLRIEREWGLKPSDDLTIIRVIL